MTTYDIVYTVNGTVRSVVIEAKDLKSARMLLETKHNDKVSLKHVTARRKQHEAV